MFALKRLFSSNRNSLFRLSKNCYSTIKEKSSCGIGILVDINKNNTRKLVENANQVLVNLKHRGGYMNDIKSGDGAGIMVNIPHDYYKHILATDMSIELPDKGKYGTGIIFLPKDEISKNLCKDIIKEKAKEVGLEVITWKEVKRNSNCLGIFSGQSEPDIEQIFLKNNYPGEITNNDLYFVQKVSTNTIDSVSDIKPGFYMCNLSKDTIIYKGQFTCEQLFQYYHDLSDPLFKCHMAMVHSRFSTNTQPSWNRAQPYRIISHNGELNTIDGNKNLLIARESNMYSPIYKDKTNLFYPIVSDRMSDSGNFDSFVQWVTKSSNYILPEILMASIPEAWMNNSNLSTDVKSFYKYNSCLLEPWDGPALIGFMDSDYVGVIQDRNGLRPSRYYVTNDNQLIISSEVGVLHDLDINTVTEKGGLLPGEMLLVDINNEKIVKNTEIKKNIASKNDYQKWNSNIKYFDDLYNEHKSKLNFNDYVPKS